MTLYKIISAIFTVLIVIPLYIVILILHSAYTLCNNLLYVNFIAITPPAYILYATNNNLFLSKLLVALISPFEQLGHEIIAISRNTKF
jgi:hypothetical protein